MPTLDEKTTAEKISNLGTLFNELEHFTAALKKAVSSYAERVEAKESGDEVKRAQEKIKSIAETTSRRCASIRGWLADADLSDKISGGRRIEIETGLRKAEAYLEANAQYIGDVGTAYTRRNVGESHSASLDVLINLVRSGNLGHANLLLGKVSDRFSYDQFLSCLKEVCAYSSGDGGSNFLIFLPALFSCTVEARRRKGCEERNEDNSVAGQHILLELLEAKETDPLSAKAFNALLLAHHHHYGYRYLNFQRLRESDAKHLFSVAINHWQLPVLTILLDKIRLEKREYVADLIGEIACTVCTGSRTSEEELKCFTQCFKTLLNWLDQRDLMRYFILGPIYSSEGGPMLPRSLRQLSESSLLCDFLDKLSPCQVVRSPEATENVFLAASLCWQSGHMSFKDCSGILEKFGCKEILFRRQSPKFEAYMLRQLTSNPGCSSVIDQLGMLSMMLETYEKQLEREIAESPCASHVTAIFYPYAKERKRLIACQRREEVDRILNELRAGLKPTLKIEERRPKPAEEGRLFEIFNLCDLLLSRVAAEFASEAPPQASPAPR